MEKPPTKTLQKLYKCKKIIDPKNFIEKHVE